MYFNYMLIKNETFL